jgi:uncharacterized protein involved in exopolysaccharide biosynthesis
MELRDVVNIFIRERRVFIGIVLGTVALGFLWYAAQPSSVVANLMLNVTRTGQRTDTSVYQYDDFYRLQADERFADTVVRWIENPRIIEDVMSEADARLLSPGVGVFGSALQAGRLSSQMIEVSYRAEDKTQAKRLATALTTRLNQQVERLNAQAHQPGWFTLQAEKPILSDGRVSLVRVMAFCGLLGVFLALWGVGLRHYWRRG